eukprot:6213609-Pleurochrysis_carterae.AAC.3
MHVALVAGVLSTVRYWIASRNGTLQGKRSCGCVCDWRAPTHAAARARVQTGCLRLARTLDQRAHRCTVLRRNFTQSAWRSPAC